LVDMKGSSSTGSIPANTRRRSGRRATMVCLT